MSKGERTQRVTELRDKALAVIQARGEMKLFGGEGSPTSGRVLQFCAGDLLIVHHTPFQKKPPHKSPYGLDVWAGGDKVLRLMWNIDGAVEVASYKPGPWEQELEAL